MSQSRNTPPPLGELEIQVLEHLWEAGESSALELHERISLKRVTTANTVQSATERLYRKGLLSREKSGHRYIYKPKVSKADLLGDLINDVVSRFQADSTSSAAAILNATEQMDEEALKLLEAEIQRRRTERKS